MAQVKIIGNTYPVKDQLKALGAKWDADGKCWTITDKKAAEAQKIVAAAPPAEPKVPGKCNKCGRVCNPPYTLCFDCKCRLDGKCVKCGTRLDEYAIRRGYKRCLDCVDGGGNAHGGQSYYDKRGNFVLGDDD
jgi:hypothetical protein